MADEPAGECPQCGYDNDTVAERCMQCGLDLGWALEKWDQHVTGPEASHPPVILRVDDEVGMLTLCEIIFTRASYRVAKAKDAFEALDLTGYFVPDLIITDDMMPRMRGIEMISRLKADPVLRDVPVVMQSARGDYESVIAAVEAGAMCFLPVPMLHQPLLAVTEAILAGNALPPLILFTHVKSAYRLLAPLSDKGYRILALYPHEETAHGAKLLKPNVIAIGVHSSVRAGLGLLAELKADDEVRDVPVVMLAAGISPLARLFICWRAAALGAQAVYSGPLDAEKLLPVFRAALEN